MDTGSFVAVVVANIVAIVAILTGLWQHSKTLAQERELSDLASVRDVLVKASSVLHMGEYALDGIRLNLSQYGAGFFGNAVYMEPYKELVRVGKETDELLAELRVRLGPKHRAVLAFELTDAAMLLTMRAMESLKLEDTEGEDRAATREFMRDIRGRVKESRETFDANQAEFFDAAHAAAGARLPAG